jgi:hypothetical protein
VQEYAPAWVPDEYATRARLPVVLTEDLLSAAKIALSNAPVVAIPCLGTIPSAAVLARASTAPAVVWWLDPDSAGQMRAQRGNRRLLALGINSVIMTTYPAGDQDPKYLAPWTIRERLTCHSSP